MKRWILTILLLSLSTLANPATEMSVLGSIELVVKDTIIPGGSSYTTGGGGVTYTEVIVNYDKNARYCHIETFEFFHTNGRVQIEMDVSRPLKVAAKFISEDGAHNLLLKDRDKTFVFHCGEIRYGDERIPYPHFPTVDEVMNTMASGVNLGAE